MDKFINNKDIEISNSIEIEEKRNLVKDFIQLIKSKLEKECSLTVDRIEENIAVCENRNTGKMLNINLSELPENVEEGDILKYKDNVYVIDEIERQEIEKRIGEKMKNLFED